MKKVTIFFAFFFALSLSSVMVAEAAPEAGVLRGKWGNVTDGDDITYDSVGANPKYEYEFAEPVDVTGYYFNTATNGFLLYLEMLDSNGNQITTISPHYESRNYYTPINVQGVKKVKLNRTGSAYVVFREIDLSIKVTPPVPPKNVQVNKNKDKARITWDAVEGAEGYYIYRDDVRVSELVTSLSYEYTYVNDRQHKWTVTAFKNKLESAPSDAVTKALDNIPPPAPKLAAEALSAGEQIRLSWNRTANDIESYNVYRDGERITSTKNTTQTIEAAYNVPHEYKVTAVDKGDNESDFSNTVTIAALYKRDSVPPSKPLELKGEGAEGAITASWKANTENDLAGYYLYLNGRQYGDMIEANNMTIYGLADLTIYKIRVAAVDLSGNVSNMSDEISIKTLKKADTKPPAAPVNLTAALAGNYLSILLSWGAVNESDVLGYYVYVSDDDLVFQQVNANPVSTTGYSFTEIEGNQTYYFKVAAVDRSGNISEKTKSVSVTVPTRDPNENVNKKNELLVTWNEIKGAVNYLIYFNGVLIATTDNQTFSFVIGEQYGYTGQPPVNVDVKAKFEDGSYGYDKNLATQSKWGFSVSDLWKSVQSLVASLGSFLLLGIAIIFAPRIFKLIKQAVLKRRENRA